MKELHCKRYPNKTNKSTPNFSSNHFGAEGWCLPYVVQLLSTNKPTMTLMEGLKGDLGIIHVSQISLFRENTRLLLIISSWKWQLGDYFRIKDFKSLLLSTTNCDSHSTHVKYPCNIMVTSFKTIDAFWRSLALGWKLKCLGIVAFAYYNSIVVDSCSWFEICPNT